MKTGYIVRHDMDSTNGESIRVANGQDAMRVEERMRRTNYACGRISTYALRTNKLVRQVEADGRGGWRQTR